MCQGKTAQKLFCGTILHFPKEARLVEHQNCDEVFWENVNIK